MWQSKGFWSPHSYGDRILSIAMPVWQPKTFWSPYSYGDRNPFSHHARVATKNLLVAIKSFPSPSCFFPSSLPPPLMVTETLLVAILCDPFIKNSILMETHWEFEWNMLGTNGKMETIFPCWKRNLTQ